MGYWTRKDGINVQLLERCSCGLLQWACMRENTDCWLAPAKEQLQLSSLLVPKEPTDTDVCTVTPSTSIRHPWLTATDNLGITECFYGHSWQKLVHRLSQYKFLYNSYPCQPKNGWHINSFVHFCLKENIDGKILPNTYDSSSLTLFSKSINRKQYFNIVLCKWWE